MLTNKINYISKVYLLLAIISLSLQACHNKHNERDEVNVHLAADPLDLNPYSITTENAQLVANHIFQSLLAIDPQSRHLVPVLAKELPTIEVKDGITHITYQLRPEATWDNGKAITAKDVAFSLKIIKNPATEVPVYKYNYEFITDILLYKEAPQKFTFLCKEANATAEFNSGDFDILPEHIFDPQGLLANYTVAQLHHMQEASSSDSALVAFAQTFSSARYKTDPQFLEGSGPYQLSAWNSGEKLVLQRKTNWWGLKSAPSNFRMEAYPAKINFLIIADNNAALVALKSGKLDVMRGIPAQTFKDLQQSEKFKARFNLHTPAILGYNFIGINHLNPILSSKKTRQALYYLTDTDYLINSIQHGLGKRTMGPFDPDLYKDSTLETYSFNPVKAKALLLEDGWQDADGNGILDKTIKGQQQEFELVYKYNAGNTQREAAGLVLQDAAKKAGIKITVLAEEWGQYLESLHSHNFDLYGGAFSLNPFMNDYWQVLHSEASENGSNYYRFANAKSDSLITALQHEREEKQRTQATQQLFQLINEEVPVIYLYLPLESMAISNQFENCQVSSISPRFWPASFKRVSN